MPAYAGEVQAASLGMDIKCFDEKGKFIALIYKKKLLMILKNHQYLQFNML